MHLFEVVLIILTLVLVLVASLEFVYLKKHRSVNVKTPWYIDYSKSFLPVLLVVLVLRSFIAEPFAVPSGSMQPTLLIGDKILVNKFVYGLRLPITGYKLVNIAAPKTGDIVVFKHKSGQNMIKRVVGIPGDHVEFKNKELYINQKKIAGVYEDKIKYNQLIPEGNYFVIGDNYNNSSDSRMWGFVVESSLIGKAFATWFSYDKDINKIRFSRVGRKIA